MKMGRAAGRVARRVGESPLGQTSRLWSDAPIAATRMTETVFPEELLELFGPELVTPAVIFLASEQAPNGEILCTGGGHFAKAQIVESPGAYLGSSPTADDVLDRFEEIADMRGGEPHEAGNKQTEKFAMRALAHRRKNA